jgi:hypothetical protein
MCTCLINGRKTGTKTSIPASGSIRQPTIRKKTFISKRIAQGLWVRAVTPASTASPIFILATSHPMIPLAPTMIMMTAVPTAVRQKICGSSRRRSSLWMKKPTNRL